MIKLSQYTIEYLLFTQDYLVEAINKLGHNLAEALDKNSVKGAGGVSKSSSRGSGHGDNYYVFFLLFLKLFKYIQTTNLNLWLKC